MQHCNRNLPSCQNTEGWEGCSLWWNPNWNAQSLELRVLWLVHLCQVAWFTGRAPKIWIIDVIITINQKEDSSNLLLVNSVTTGGYLSIDCLQKCLDKRCCKNYWTKADWHSAVFIPAPHYKKQFHSLVTFRGILGVCQRGPHMFCRPRESIRSGSSWKHLWIAAGAPCWRPPFTGRQVTVFLLRSLCPGRRSYWKSQPLTVVDVLH